MNKAKCLSIFLLGAFTALAIGAIMNGRGAKEPIKEIVRITDTVRVVRIDTVKIVKPIPRLVEIVKKDTIFVADTVYITVPIERKIYKDSTYTATITGYRAELESLEVYPKTIIQTITQKEIAYKYAPKRWGLGICVGYGVTGDFRLSPFVGIGVNYNLFSW